MKKLYLQPPVAIHAVIFLFIAAASAKSAMECSVMVPMMGTIWKTNEMVTVRWSGFKEGNIPAIILARTNEEGALVDIAQIASDVPAAPGKHSLKLPANIPPADQYVIILKDVKKGKCTSNSFFIEQGSPMGPVDINNPPLDAELPSLEGPTQALSTETHSAPSSYPTSSAPGSNTSTSTSSSSGHHSRTAHEAVRTGTGVQKPNSAAESRDVASHTLGLLLALIVLSQVFVV